MTTPNLIIRMDDIRKTYDTGKVKVEALKGINLEIEKGEMIAIVGPAGSGKSTLMNLVGCLDTPTSGIYEIGGQAVAASRDMADIRNRRVSSSFRRSASCPTSPLRDVRLPMLFGAVRPAERRERASQLLGRRPRAVSISRPSSPAARCSAAIAAYGQGPTSSRRRGPHGNLDSSAGGGIMSIFTDLWQQGHDRVITHDPALSRPREQVVAIHDGSRRTRPRTRRETSYTSLAFRICHGR